MNTRKTIWAAAVVIVFAALAYAVWISIEKTAPLTGTKNASQEGVACTLDAMMCPDGSWVGRSGPNCQFVCPIGTSTQTGKKEVLLQAKINQSGSGLDVKVTPLEVIEDSRCPQDVQCIQAGTVKVRTQLVSGLGTATEVFTLNTPITTEAETITLVSVQPVKESKKTIGLNDYVFTFKVTKR